MDPSWCPGCDRLILPKRYIVPVSPTPTPAPLPSPEPEIASSTDSEHNPPPPPAPTPVPSSPEVRKKPFETRARRLGGGLVHGTGRVRLGGGLKPRGDKKSAQAAAAAAAKAAVAAPAPPAAASKPSSAPPKKTRVIISQELTPLYCSEECRKRDLKNSYIESESAGFSGAPAALNHLAQLEFVQETFQRCLQNRRSSSSSSNSSAPLSTPPVPPNSLVDAPSSHQPVFRSDSMSSTDTSVSASSLKPADSDASIAEPVSASVAAAAAPVDDTTVRAPKRSTLIPRVPSWGSPTKAALAPPAHTLYTCTASMSSIDSSVSSIFELETVSSSSPGTSAKSDGGKKKKRVSFAEDTKVKMTESPEQEREGAETQTDSQNQTQASTNTDTNTTTSTNSTITNNNTNTDQYLRPAMHPRTQSCQSWLPPRRRNPFLDAESLRAAVSVSPKDRIKPASMPTIQQQLSSSALSASTPALMANAVLDTSPRRTMSPSNKYHVAMWPEDEKRMTESAKANGLLLKNYVKRFGPREGRTWCYTALLKEEAEEIEIGIKPSKPGAVVPVIAPDGKLTTSSAAPAVVDHDAQPDSATAYWDEFEAQRAALRAKRKAKETVARLEEERVICDLLGGQGMREEDQPQARRMKKMAYDGMPCPPEMRGLEYRFEKFLYEVKWDGGKESNGERKRLFNFEE